MLILAVIYARKGKNISYGLTANTLIRSTLVWLWKAYKWIKIFSKFYQGHLTYVGDSNSVENHFITGYRE